MHSDLNAREGGACPDWTGLQILTTKTNFWPVNLELASSPCLAFQSVEYYAQ